MKRTKCPCVRPPLNLAVAGYQSNPVTYHFLAFRLPLSLEATQPIRLIHTLHSTHHLKVPTHATTATPHAHKSLPRQCRGAWTMVAREKKSLGKGRNYIAPGFYS